MSNRRNLIGEAAMAMSGSVEPIDTNNYLTIVALEDGLTAQLSVNACEYCVDGDGDWKALSADTATESINKGQTLSFRGNLTPNSSSGIGTFTISKSCNLEGNCMSMLFGDNAASKTSLSGKNYAFRYLFKDCTTIKSVSSGFLPATTLASDCYSSMFRGCTNLTQSPELPSTTLANFCYYYMFQGCTSLTTAPELPATTLKRACYSDMFSDCTKLTQTPSILPATTLESSCYSGMFENCTSLTTAPELPATTLASYCYKGMFENCTSLTASPELPATTLADNCYRSMFSNCTSLTTAPELPATTLKSACYFDMFSDCTKLTQTPSILPATTLESSCYSGMFYNCTNLTTAPELPATTLVSYCYQYMFYNCTKLNYIKAMFTTTPSKDYTLFWVSGVASTGKFIKNKNATWNVTAIMGNSYIGIPSGWTVQKVAQ